MELLPIAKGIGIGIAVAAPVGPMSIICMRRTLTRGWRLGMWTGLGIATGDGLFAAVATLGLAGITQFMAAHSRPLHLAAGLFLSYLGIKMLLGSGTALVSAERDANTAGYASALLLTLTNVPTIASFAAAFTFLAPTSGFNSATAAQTACGVFLGSALWWIALAGTVALMRHAIGRRVRRAIDLVSGALLSAFGVGEIRRAI